MDIIIIIIIIRVFLVVLSRRQPSHSHGQTAAIRRYRRPHETKTRH